MQVKNIDFWEKLLKEMPESYKSWFADECKFLQKTITKDSKVLEVGCGDGRSIKEIINITQNVTGIDHDEKAVKDAKVNFKDYSAIKILLADAKELPFQDESFDFVLCMTTFANLGNDKLSVLKEMKRTLKKKGRIIISVYSEDAFEERLKLYKKLGVPIEKIAKNGKLIFDEKIRDNVSEQFSKKELIEIFKKVNLKGEEIFKSGIGYICCLSK